MKGRNGRAGGGVACGGGRAMHTATQWKGMKELLLDLTPPAGRSSRWRSSPQSGTRACARGPGRGGAGRGRGPLTHGAVEVVGRHRPRVPADARARGASAPPPRRGGGRRGDWDGRAPERAVGAGPAGHRPGAAPEHRPGRHPPGGRGARAPARPRGAHRRHFFRRLVWGSLSVCLSVWRVEQCNPGEGAGVEVLLGAKGRVLGSPGAVVVSCFAVHPHSSTPRESFPSEERFTSEEQGAHLHRALEPSR